VLLVALAIAASVGAGLAAERRYGERAHGWSRAVLAVLLWAVLPFVTFFTLARLELTAGVGGGLLLGHLVLAVVGLAAYLFGSRVLRLEPPALGALVVAVTLANTGYLGVPLNAALLGADAVAPAIAWDTVVSGPMFYVVGFAIGAVLGTHASGARERLRAFVVRNPPLLAVVAGLLAPDALAPDALVDVAEVLVFAVLPLGFFALGVTLSTEPVTFRLDRAVATVLGLRLLAAPLLLAALAAVVVSVPDAYRVQAAMPVGINSLVVAHATGLDLRLTSAALAWSTTLVVAAGVVAAAVA
jgi:malate permease and related proteins